MASTNTSASVVDKPSDDAPANTSTTKQPTPPTNPAATTAAPSPRITSIVWGTVDVAGLGEVRDAKLWPGGGRAWDWGETGTRHRPGVQVADVEELLAQGATTVVLSRGMQEKLGVPDATVAALEARGVEVHALETKAACALYNKLVGEGKGKIGGLFHSTC